MTENERFFFFCYFITPQKYTRGGYIAPSHAHTTHALRGLLSRCVVTVAGRQGAHVHEGGWVVVVIEVLRWFS